MFHRSVFLGAALLALFLAIASPGQAYAQNGHCGSHSGFRPGYSGGSYGYGRRFFDPRFGGFDRDFDRRFFLFGFGGF